MPLLIDDPRRPPPLPRPHLNRKELLDYWIPSVSVSRLTFVNYLFYNGPSLTMLIGVYL